MTEMDIDWPRRSKGLAGKTLWARYDDAGELIESGCESHGGVINLQTVHRAIPLSAFQKMMDAQPDSLWLAIGEAPKDGTPVDLWVRFIKNNEVRFTNCVWTDDGHGEMMWYCRDRFIWLRSEHGFKPTHYMLIPDRPMS